MKQKKHKRVEWDQDTQSGKAIITEHTDLWNGFVMMTLDEIDGLYRWAHAKRRHILKHSKKV